MGKGTLIQPLWPTWDVLTLFLTRSNCATLLLSDVLNSLFPSLDPLTRDFRVILLGESTKWSLIEPSPIWILLIPFCWAFTPQFDGCMRFHVGLGHGIARQLSLSSRLSSLSLSGLWDTDFAVKIVKYLRSSSRCNARDARNKTRAIFNEQKSVTDYGGGKCM